MKKEKIFIVYSLSLKSDIDNIRYIGITQRTLRERYNQHKYNAFKSNKRIAPVHKWMFSKISQGEEIIIKQIDVCTEKDWEFIEKYWIKYYKDKGHNLLNVSSGGCGVVTAKMRNKNGNKRSQEAHYTPVICLNLDGTFVKKYKCIKDANKDMGLSSRSAISNAINGRSKSCCGFLWIYEKNYKPSINYHYEAYTHKRIKVYEFNIKGEMISTYNSYTEVNKKDGYSMGGLKFAITNKTPYHNSYWAIQPSINIDEYGPIYKYILFKGEKIMELRSFDEISMVIGMSPSWICNAFKNKQEITYNDYVIKKI